MAAPMMASVIWSIFIGTSLASIEKEIIVIP